MAENHYTRAKHIGDVTIPGAHSISFQDPDTLYISQDNMKSKGGMTKCTVSTLKLEDIPVKSCNCYGVAVAPDGDLVIRSVVENEMEIHSRETNWKLPAGKHKGMAVDQRTEHIYICDAKIESSCIREYDMSGKLIGVLKNKDLKSPQYITLVTSGLVVTCTGGGPKVLCMDKESEILWSYGELNWPMGVAADDNNDIYVCDGEESKVVMMTSEGNIRGDIITKEMMGHEKPFAVAVKGNHLAVQLLPSNTVKLFRLSTY